MNGPPGPELRCPTQTVSHCDPTQLEFAVAHGPAAAGARAGKACWMLGSGSSVSPARAGDVAATTATSAMRAEKARARERAPSGIRIVDSVLVMCPSARRQENHPPRSERAMGEAGRSDRVEVHARRGACAARQLAVPHHAV